MLFNLLPLLKRLFNPKLRLQRTLASTNRASNDCANALIQDYLRNQTLKN